MDNFNDTEEFDELDEDDLIVVVKDDEGAEHEYIIVDAVVHKGSNYMLVTPADYDDDSDDFEACIIKEIEENGDEVIYSLVEDEVEFNEVAALFMENADDYGIEV